MRASTASFPASTRSAGSWAGSDGERLEEAVDFVCLEALVKRRQALSLPAPIADNTRDREEFTRSVHTFLAELRSAIDPTLSESQRQKMAAAERPLTVIAVMSAPSSRVNAIAVNSTT